MNKTIILTLLIIVSINSFGQNYYEKGYFVNNENGTTDCYIKNNDWRKNPTQFKYKLTEDSAVQEADITHVKEINILNSCKYVRAEVNIDLSSSVLKNLSLNKNPIWQRKQLFLKVLVEGEATLYYYGGNIGERFFYSCKDTVIDQLIFKEYIYDIDHTAFNDTFRLQLQKNVRCSFASDIALSDLPYDKEHLEKYFIDYNTCIDPTYKMPEKKQNKGKFSLALSTGLAYSSLLILHDTRAFIDTDFGNNFIQSSAMEIEYILPFNNDKWGVVLSPAYQSFHSKKYTDFKNTTIDFESIDLALGIKHYLFLNDNAKFFVEGYLNSIWNHSINSKIGYKLSTTKDLSYLDITAVYNTNFIFGVGFEYKRIFTQLRYYTNQNIISRYVAWHSDFEKISFNIGYKILKTRR